MYAVCYSKLYAHLKKQMAWKKPSVAHNSSRTNSSLFLHTLFLPFPCFFVALNSLEHIEQEIERWFVGFPDGTFWSFSNLDLFITSFISSMLCISHQKNHVLRLNRVDHYFCGAIFLFHKPVEKVFYEDIRCEKPFNFFSLNFIFEMNEFSVFFVCDVLFYDSKYTCSKLQPRNGKMANVEVHLTMVHEYYVCRTFHSHNK